MSINTVTAEDLFKLRNALNKALPDILKLINRALSPDVKDLRTLLMGLAVRNFPYVNMDLTLQTNPYKPELIGYRFHLKPGDVKLAKRYMIVKSKNDMNPTIEIVPRKEGAGRTYSQYDFDPTEDATRFVNTNGGEVEIWQRVAVVKSARAVVERDPV